MVEQALLLLVDVQFLYVENHLLLQAAPVVLHLGDGRKGVCQPLADLLGTCLLVRFDTLHQGLYVVRFLAELLLQGLALLGAEIHQLVHCLPGHGAGHVPFLFGQFLHGFLLADGIRHLQDYLREIFGHGYAVLRVRLVELLDVFLHQRNVQFCCLLHFVALYPQGELHLAAQKGVADDGTQFHFLLAIARGHAYGQVQSLAVQGFYLGGNLLVVVGGRSLTVAGH